MNVLERALLPKQDDASCQSVSPTSIDDKMHQSTNAVFAEVEKSPITGTTTSKR